MLDADFEPAAQEGARDAQCCEAERTHTATTRHCFQSKRSLECAVCSLAVRSPRDSARVHLYALSAQLY